MNQSFTTKIGRLSLMVILLTGILFSSNGPSSVRAAGTIRYASSTGLASGNCDIWAKACTLMYALSKAISGDQIWVKQGTYKPHATDRTLSFVLKNGLKVYGGFAGSETSLNQRNPDVNITVLSGEINAANKNEDNSYHVVVASGTNSTAVLDGMRITEGFANGTTAINQRGGGLYNDGGSPTLTNLIFIQNNAKTQGGGMYNTGGAAPKLSLVTFSENTASTLGSNGRGGGMYNTGSNPTLTNVTFTGNIADFGGGMFNTLNSNPTLTMVTLNANQSNNGGGIYNQVSSPTLTNVTIQGNSSLKGGGVFNTGTSTPTLKNVTISGNSATDNGGGMYSGNSTPSLVNVILWNNSSTTGLAEVFNNGSTPVIDNSVVEGGCPAGASCTTIITGNPLLSPLADNGGSTKTMAIDDHGSAMDTGSDADCPGVDQRGVSRPVGPHCDIGAFESTDLPTTVVSITRSIGATNPTSKTKVGFVVTFSQAVINVDVTDFTLTKTGNISNETIESVNGSGIVYGVIVDTGTGNGTLRLDIPITTDIVDLSGDPPINLPFVSGESYTVQKSLKFLSNSTEDGWILESGENTNAGGTLDSIATTLRIGDDSANKQYRSILSFDTSGLPDNALITKVLLKVKKQSITGGGNPISDFGGLLVDIRNGPFDAPALQLTDWQMAPVITAGPFAPILTSGWYTINLTNAKAYINRVSTNYGLTQIRLRFLADDNNNALDNFLSFFSGNVGITSRPQLIVEFYVP